MSQKKLNIFQKKWHKIKKAIFKLSISTKIDKNKSEFNDHDLSDEIKLGITIFKKILYSDDVKIFYKRKDQDTKIIIYDNNNIIHIENTDYAFDVMKIKHEDVVLTIILPIKVLIHLHWLIERRSLLNYNKLFLEVTNTNDKQINKLNNQIKPMKDIYLYDFDGTLGLTPTPETGKPLYTSITGNEWPYVGWWSKIESMLPEFNIKLNTELKDFANEKINTDLVYILTSRLNYFTDRIYDICINNNFNIDKSKILTKNAYSKGERIYKLIQELLIDKQPIKNVYFYDDRIIEIEDAKEWKTKIESLGVNFIIVHHGINE